MACLIRAPLDPRISCLAGCGIVMDGGKLALGPVKRKERSDPRMPDGILPVRVLRAFSFGRSPVTVPLRRA